MDNPSCHNRIKKTATTYQKKPHAYKEKKGQCDQQREQNQKWSPTKGNKIRVPNPNSRGQGQSVELHAHTCHKRIPPPPPTPPRSPSPSLVVACTLGLEGPHNGAGREAWPAIALRASRVASADQYSHTHTHTHPFFYALPLMHFSPHGVFLTPWCNPNPMTDLDVFQLPCYNSNHMVYFEPHDCLGDP